MVPVEFCLSCRAAVMPPPGTASYPVWCNPLKLLSLIKHLAPCPLISGCLPIPPPPLPLSLFTPPPVRYFLCPSVRLVSWWPLLLRTRCSSCTTPTRGRSECAASLARGGCAGRRALAGPSQVLPSSCCRRGPLGAESRRHDSPADAFNPAPQVF